MKESPLTVEELTKLVETLGPFEPRPRIAVAVSGGKDSLALALLLKAWVDQNQGHLMAVTVDHQLRPESKDEAMQVHAWLTEKKIDHHILAWEGAKPQSHLQEAARNARYALLRAWCRDQGILHLFLAHHAGDQIETFFLRLERESGPDGLCGIGSIVETPYLRILRPLLTVSPKRLQSFLGQQRQAWIDDPSNGNLSYRRNQIRRILASDLNKHTETRILKTMEEMTAERVKLEAETMHSLARCSQVYSLGYAIVLLDKLRDEPKQIQLRLLSYLLMLVSGEIYPPRSRYLERLYDALTQPSPFKTRTCWGCVLRPYKGNLMIVREYAAINDPMPLEEKQNESWDQRFWVTAKADAKKTNKSKKMVVAKLGFEAWKHIAKFIAPTYDARVISHVFPTLPALWLDSTVVAVPQLHYYAQHSKWSEDSVEITFAPKIKSYKPLFTIR